MSLAQVRNPLRFRGRGAIGSSCTWHDFPSGAVRRIDRIRGRAGQVSGGRGAHRKNRSGSGHEKRALRNDRGAPDPQAGCPEPVPAGRHPPKGAARAGSGRTGRQARVRRLTLERATLPTESIQDSATRMEKVTGSMTMAGWFSIFMAVSAA